MTGATDPPCSQKYGVPLFGAAWAPRSVFGSDAEEKASGKDDPPSESADAARSTSAENYVVFAGGGGEGRSGIPNAILISHFDFSANCLSEQPVVKLGTGADVPYRMAVHPGGEGIICSFPKSCRLFEWDESSEGDHKLGVKLSDKVLTQLQDVGQQLALTFSDNGSLLAVGSEDGDLKVFRWPGMEIIISKERAHSAVKDLDFSQDGKFLVSVGSGGPCRVWDMSSSEVVTSLPKKKDEVFGFCRFSQRENGSVVLYTTTLQDKGGYIVTWNPTTWQRMSSKRIVRDPVSAFNVSDDGKLLAIGTIHGDVLVINSDKMVVQMVINKAHMGIVTTLAFSSDSRALASTSMDSSARVTLIKELKPQGFNYWIIVLIVLLAIIIYLIKDRGLIP